MHIVIGEIGVAGRCGSRTHQGHFHSPTQVLKTRRPTGTYTLPFMALEHAYPPLFW